eukprot:CFRG8589T1
MSSGLTLHYFPIRAAAEPIRMIFKYGKIDFDNVVVDFADWPARKQNLDICPLQQLPTLQLKDGSIVSQAGSIARYAAKLANIYPSSPEACLKTDMAFELSREMIIINPVINWFEEGSEEYNKARNAFFNSFSRWLDACERMIGSNAYFNGDSPSYGDFGMLHVLLLTLIADPLALEPYPITASWLKNMCELDAVKEYLQETEAANYGRENSLLKRRQEETAMVAREFTGSS